MLSESEDYGLPMRNELPCARPQEEHFGELPAVIVGKGFPFTEELISCSASVKSASGLTVGKRHFLSYAYHMYVIENTINTSVPVYALQSSTLVRCVQSGMCNQFTTPGSGWQESSQGTRGKGLKSMRVTDVTQRAKL